MLATLLLTAIVAGASSPSELLSKTTGAESPSHGTTFRVQVRSDWQVDALSAQAEAEQRLLTALGQLARSADETDPAVGADRSVRSLALAEGVGRADTAASREKPYGTLYQHAVRLDVPRSVLNAWLAERRAEQTHRRQVRGLVAVALLGAIGLALLAAWCFDRWTRGYRRGFLATMAAVLTLFAVIAVLTLWP